MSFPTIYRTFVKTVLQPWNTPTLLMIEILHCLKDPKLWEKGTFPTMGNADLYHQPY